MSKWSDRFKQHPCNTTLQNFVSTLEKHPLPENSADSTVEDYARINKVVIYIQNVLKNVDFDLISPNVLNEIHGQLKPAFDDFNNFISKDRKSVV